MELPQDINMLFSFINMKLRDEYDSLDSLCEDMGVEKSEIIDRLKLGGWEYSPENNKFW